MRGFLLQYGDLYGFSAADVADLVVLGDSPGGASGLLGGYALDRRVGLSCESEAGTLR